MKKIFVIFLFVICTGCEKSLECEDGYNLINGTCVKEIVISAPSEKSYYCNNSIYDEKLEGDKCVYYVNIPANKLSNCPTYYREYGSRCKFMFGTYSSNCPYGQKQWGNKCYEEYLSNNSYYYCLQGQLVGTTCVNKYTYDAFEKYEYYCPSGYDLVSEYGLCIKKIYKDPQ